MKPQRGVITAFLSLTLIIVIALLLIVIESAREKAIRARVEMAMDMGIQSVFAEYNRELLEKYDLYFIDTSYGSSSGNIYYTGEHLKDYMEYNLNPAKGQLVFQTKDLFSMKVNQVGITQFSLATDDGAAVFKRQAIHAIKDKYGISLIQQITKQKQIYENKGIGTFSPDEERQKNRERLRKAEGATDEMGNSIEFENPAEKIEKERTGILQLILSDQKISGKSFAIEKYPSHRELKEGDGIIENSENLNSMTNELLFDEYIEDKFGCYTEQKGREAISYEMEYILEGKNADSENLRAVMKKLLLLRESSNVLYLLSDPQKQAEAEEIAVIAASLILMPELTEVIKYSIILAWGFAEAAVDVRTLLDGGKVPMFKSSAEWILPLSKALLFKAHLKDGARVQTGCDYQTYLKLFLELQNKENKVYRCLDVIEMNLQKTEGNKSFAIDNCVEFLEAEADVKSSFGYNYKVKRFFGYEAMPVMSYE